MKSKRNLVVQSNELVRAKTSLTKLQMKIILKAISLIEKDEKDLGKSYEISIREFSKDINYSSNSCVKELTDVAKGIVGKTLVIRSSSSVLVTSWASDIEFSAGTMSISFSEKLKPYLLELKQFFTSYELGNILLLNSQSSIRLYQLLRSYLNLGLLEIGLEDLKEILGSKASLYGKFRQGVILPAQEEINEKTDIIFSFVPIKTGKKVTALKFKIKQKSEKLNEKTNDDICNIRQAHEREQKEAVEQSEAREEEILKFKKHLESLPDYEKKKTLEEINTLFGKDQDLKIWTYFKKKELSERIG